MEYKIEKYEDILEDINGITEDFISEIDVYPENPKPNIDHDQYITADKTGNLQVITARDKGEFMGLHVSMIMSDMFYKHITTAYVLFYYLKKQARGLGYGLNLFEFAESKFKSNNVERVFMTRKVYINNSNLFKKLGFSHIENGYTKYIG